MRDAGKAWPEIRAAYAKITGTQSGNSTLPNRYARLKANFTVIKEEHHSLLLEAKNEVEVGFEKGKWEVVSQLMVKRGCPDTYPVSSLSLCGVV